MPFKVLAHQCETCIFGANSPISATRFQELAAVWAAQDIVQECHSATINGQQIGCRGHYEAARRGAIPHPVTGIAATMGIVGLSTADLMQIYERMQLIIFVDVEAQS